MSIELNHTIIPAKDKWAAAKFLADILNLEAGPEWGHFVPVRTGNGVTLDFSDSVDFRPQHYAFLVGDVEFDAALARIPDAGVAHYANFRRERPGEINHLYGGRGVYFRRSERSFDGANHATLRPHPSRVTSTTRLEIEVPAQGRSGAL